MFGSLAANETIIALDVGATLLKLDLRGATAPLSRRTSGTRITVSHACMHNVKLTKLLRRQPRIEIAGLHKPIRALQVQYKFTTSID